MKDSLLFSKKRDSSKNQRTALFDPESAFRELGAGISRIADELGRIHKLLENGAGCNSKPALAPQADAPAVLSQADQQAQTPKADAQDMIALDIEAFLKRNR